MAAVAASATAMAAVAASATALLACARSAVAMNRIAKATKSTGTVNFVKAMNQSVALLKAAYTSVRNTSHFTKSASEAQDTVTNLNNRCTNSGAWVLVATGYYSSDSSYTNVFYDGEKVSGGTLVNTVKPQSVTQSNIGAITLTPATFTEKNDGYASIEVWTAL